MKYLCLICAETVMEQRTEADAEKHFEEYRVFTEDQEKRPIRRLQPTAATARRDYGADAQRQGLDHRWPYAETKEQLGGYYVIEA